MRELSLFCNEHSVNKKTKKKKKIKLQNNFCIFLPSSFLPQMKLENYARKKDHYIDLDEFQISQS